MIPSRALIKRITIPVNTSLAKRNGPRLGFSRHILGRVPGLLSRKPKASPQNFDNSCQAALDLAHGCTVDGGWQNCSSPVAWGQLRICCEVTKSHCQARWSSTRTASARYATNGSKPPVQLAGGGSIAEIRILTGAGVFLGVLSALVLSYSF